MRKFRYIVPLVLFLFVNILGVSAQEIEEKVKVLPSTTEGTDFWLAFPRISGTAVNDGLLNLRVIVVAREAVDVVIAKGTNDQVVTTLSVGEGGGMQEFLLKPGTQPILAYLDESEKVVDRSFHVYAKDRRTPFSCYMYARSGDMAGTSRDASLVLPVEALGYEYTISTYPEDKACTEFAIVATENNTKVRITPSTLTYGGKPAGTPININLKRGQSYLVRSQVLKDGVKKKEGDTLDMSGSVICSTKPIAVYEANEAALIPYVESYSDDYTMEHVPSVNSLGTSFYVPFLNPKIKGMYCTVTAVFDNTEVTQLRYNASTGKVVTVKDVLGAGESLAVRPPMNDVTKNIVIKSTQPILCYTYFTSATINQEEYQDPSTGEKKSRPWGDPSNAYIPAWTQKVKDISFFTYDLDPQVVTDDQYKMVQVTVPTNEVSKLRLDDQPIPSSVTFTTYGGDRAMSYACIPVDSAGLHTLTTTGSGFVGTVYALSTAISYMYTLGYLPDPVKDSLYLNENTNYMQSYDLKKRPNGWYFRQLKEWLKPEERLDTAQVCDSTTLKFRARLDEDLEKHSWEVWQIKNGKPSKKVYTEESEDAEKLQNWSYQFVTEDQSTVLPTRRSPFTEYLVYSISERRHVICEDFDIRRDTLKSVVRVLRQYNDTTWKAVCVSDSVKFFNDNFFSPQVDEKYATTFAHEKYDALKHIMPFKLGPNSYTRRYTTIHGCDSIVTLCLYACDTAYLRVDTTICELALDTFQLCLQKAYPGHFITKYDFKFDPDHRIQQFKDKILTSCLDNPDDSICQLYKSHCAAFKGCSDIIELNLNIMPVKIDYRNRSWCISDDPMQTYDWYDQDGNLIKAITKDVFRPGQNDSLFFYHVLHEGCTTCPGWGCDSILYMLQLQKVTSTSKTSTVHICQNTSYTRQLADNESSTFYPGGKREFKGSELKVGMNTFKSTIIIGHEETHTEMCRYEDTFNVIVHLIYNDTSTITSMVDRESVCAQSTTTYFAWENHDSHKIWDVTNSRYIYADSIPVVLPKVGSTDVTGKVLTYVDSLKTLSCPECQYDKIIGCDSIWTLKLSVGRPWTIEDKRVMCDNDTMTWQDTLYYGPKYRNTIPPELRDKSKQVFGSLYQTRKMFTSSYNCDSVRVLKLTINATVEEFLDTSVCVGQPYLFLDSITYVWTEPKDTTLKDVQSKTEYGCERGIVHHVRVYPVYNIAEPDTFVCRLPNAFFHWKNHTTTDDTIRQLYLKDATGFIRPVWSDSIAIDSVGLFTLIDSLKTYSCDSCVGTHSCDSVHTLSLRVTPIYNDTSFLELCSNETVIWQRTLYVGDTYDSINHPLPTSSPDWDVIYRLTKQQRLLGLYERTIPEQTRYYGCDSILNLHLILHESPVLTLHSKIGDNDTTWHCGTHTGYEFHLPNPEDYTKTGRTIRTFYFSDSTKSVITGCDSVTFDSVTIVPTYRFVHDTSVCSAIDFHWRKYTYLNREKSGVYYDSLKTQGHADPRYNGMDSVYVLNLKIIPNFYSYQFKHLCKNDTIIWQHTKIYFQKDNETDLFTRYRINYPSVTGCDSVYEMDAQFYDYYHFPYDVDSVHQYHRYHWMDSLGGEHTLQLRDSAGNVLTKIPTDSAGWITIYDSLHTSSPCHCDSTFMLRLYVKPAYYFYDTIEICSGDTARWRNREYTSEVATILRDSVCFRTTLDCDSNYYITVLVHQTYNFQESDVVCGSNLPYHWKGHPNGIDIPSSEALTWKRDSTFVLWDSCVSIFGCDSIYRRQVVVKPIRHTFLEDTICYGDTLTYHWHRLYEPGVYTDTLTNQWGCDSMVTLDLSFVPVTQFTLANLPLICAGDAAFDINYTYQGEYPLAYQIHFNQKARLQGFEDVPWQGIQEGNQVLSVPLPRPIDGDRTRYPMPDNYTMDIYFDNGFCLDSNLLKVPVAFTMLYPSWLMEQHWNDAIGLLVDSLNGNYHFTSFQWYKNDILLPGETRPYFYAPQYLEENATYSVALTRTSDRQTFLTCPMTPNLSNPQYTTPRLPYISVVPTAVVHANPVVNILCVHEGDYEVYDAMGNQCLTGHFVPGAHQAYEVRLPDIPGVYVFLLYEKTGLERTIKVLVQ